MKKVFAFFVAALFAANLFAGEYPDVSIKELKKAIDGKKVVLLDVNGSNRFAKGHIPGHNWDP